MVAALQVCWVFAYATMCESVTLLIAARVLFALPVARRLPYDDVQGTHAVYRYPLSFSRATASVALRILFAARVACCNMYDGERTVHALDAAV